MRSECAPLRACPRRGGVQRRSLNPVKRVWLYLRERFLSHRLFADLGAVIDGCCDAWNRLLDEQGRIASLPDYAYLRSVRTS